MRKILLITIYALIFSACANISAPSGGPVDKEPPQVVSFSPAQFTKNFKDNSIKIEFNKYMNRTSLPENIFIMPTVKAEYDWSATELEITFSEKLKENTTYAVNLGTEYSDIRNNKPAEAFTLIFTTGNVIDSGSISGKTAGAEAAGAFIFVYSLEGMNADTLNPFTVLPDYKTQIGSNGNFTINALKDGKYRIFAVKDKFKDGIINELQDEFGAAMFDANVVNSKSEFIMMRLGNSLDKTPPELYAAEALTLRSVKLSLSEALDINAISPNDFQLSDSAQSNTIPIVSAFPLYGEKSIVLVTGADLPLSEKLGLFSADTLKSADSSSNILKKFKPVYFTSSKELPDDFPMIKHFAVKDSSRNIALDSSLYIEFSNAIDSSSLVGKFFLIDSDRNDTLASRLEMISPNYYRVRTEKTFDGLKWYRAVLNTSGISSISGYEMADTLIKSDFLAEASRGLGSLSGKILDSAYCNSDTYIIMSSTETKNVYTCKAVNGVWKIDDMKPGSYTAIAFCDKNKDGKYDYGNCFPITYSEPFYIFDQVFSVRPRWETSDLILILRERQ